MHFSPVIPQTQAHGKYNGANWTGQPLVPHCVLAWRLLQDCLQVPTMYAASTTCTCAQTCFCFYTTAARSNHLHQVPTCDHGSCFCSWNACVCCCSCCVCACSGPSSCSVIDGCRCGSCRPCCCSCYAIDGARCACGSCCWTGTLCGCCCGCGCDSSCLVGYPPGSLCCVCGPCQGCGCAASPCWRHHRHHHQQQQQQCQDGCHWLLLLPAQLVLLPPAQLALLQPVQLVRLPPVMLLLRHWQHHTQAGHRRD